MITKRSKGCWPYFYKQIKYKSIAVDNKSKKWGRLLNHSTKKELLTLNMSPKISKEN